MKDNEIRKEINFYILTWVCSIFLISFIGGFVFGNYYTEQNDFNYTCSDIITMMILDDFPKHYNKITYVDTFYRDRMSWNTYREEIFYEDDFRNYYIINCVNDALHENVKEVSE